MLLSWITYLKQIIWLSESNIQPGYSLRTFTGHSASVMSLDFHPNKEDLICSCDGDGEIRYWSINNGSCARVFKVWNNVISSTLNFFHKIVFLLQCFDFFFHEKFQLFDNFELFHVLAGWNSPNAISTSSGKVSCSRCWQCYFHTRCRDTGLQEFAKG